MYDAYWYGLLLTLLGPQSRFGDRLLIIRVLCPHIWQCGAKGVNKAIHFCKNSLHFRFEHLTAFELPAALALIVVRVPQTIFAGVALWTYTAPVHGVAHEQGGPGCC